jgi:hypothetical protein
VSWLQQVFFDLGFKGCLLRGESRGLRVSGVYVCSMRNPQCESQILHRMLCESQILQHPVQHPVLRKTRFYAR